MKRLLLLFALMLFPTALAAQFIPHAPAKVGYCLNPSLQWTPIAANVTGSVLPNGAPATDLYGLNSNGAFYAVACDASGNLQLSLGNYATAPATCSTGQTYFNTGNSTPYFCSAANTWTAFGSSGGGGSGIIFPESYGAVGDGNTYFDGATGGGFATENKNTGSTSPSAPTITTIAGNSVVISNFTLQSTWSSAPAVPTQRLGVPYTSGLWGMYAYDQTVTSAGVVPAVSGTIASSTTWLASSIVLTPVVGQTISYVNSASAAQSSGTPLVINVPTGYAAGDTFILCLDGFKTGGTNPFTPPTAFTSATLLYAQNQGNYYNECYAKLATGSEPSSYSTAMAGGQGIGGYILDYRNVAAATQLSSATANFTPAAAGKPICVAGTASGAKQTCGTISSYISSSAVMLSFTPSLGVSGAQFAFGTDNAAAFSSMMTTAPCSTQGCKIQFGPYRYATTSSFPTLPPNISIDMEGVGPGLPQAANGYVNSNTPYDVNSGTNILFLTTSLSGSAVTIGGNASLVGNSGSSVMNQIGLIGGAGIARDGGGFDGVDILTMQMVEMHHVFVENFARHCFYIDGQTGSTTLSYAEAILLNGVYGTYCGNQGLQIGDSSSSYFLETIKIANSIFETNGGPGVEISGTLDGFSLTNSVLQWNNLTSANSEFYVAGTVAGGEVSGNYVEVDTVNGSESNSAWGNTVGMVGIRFGENFIYPAAKVVTHPTYSVAGTPLPSCSTSSVYVLHRNACVSDAVTCVNGTTYAGSGTTACSVQCNGSGNWVETGASQGCN